MEVRPHGMLEPASQLLREGPANGFPVVAVVVLDVGAGRLRSVVRDRGACRTRDAGDRDQPRDGGLDNAMTAVTHDVRIGTLAPPLESPGPSRLPRSNARA